MRLVLDSNVLISAFASRGLCADLFRDVLAEHELFISDYILDEVTEKLETKLNVPPATVHGIKNLLQQFRLGAELDLSLNVDIRDPDDIPIVAYAVAIHADLLITGDQDLLDVADQLPLAVLSPREFYQRQDEQD